jgi:catechol 2,3-dioxygenase-like lactoylglutathione lyase family enzyme
MAKTAVAKAPKTQSELKLGKVERVILYVADFDRAVKFYTETLGLSLLHKDEGWAALGTQGTEIDLHHGRRPKPQENDANIGFRVEDFDSAYAALKDRGVKVGKVFSPCGGLRCAGFTDPDGNKLGIEGK